MPNTFTKELRVSPEHIDDLQHVNNVVYLQWVQDIAAEHWFTASQNLKLDNLVWVARDHHIEYFAPALLNEDLVLKTFVDKTEGVSSFRCVEIFRANKIICKCKSRWILVDKESMRPCRVPQEICDLFLWIIPKELVAI